MDLEKKEGGFVNRAEWKGKIIEGDELERELLRHYKENHTLIESTDETAFPQLKIGQSKVREMMRNVPTNRGIAFDGIIDKLFNTKDEQRYNELDEKKVKLAKEIAENKEFWDSEEAKQPQQALPRRIVVRDAVAGEGSEMDHVRGSIYTIFRRLYRIQINYSSAIFV